VNARRYTGSLLVLLAVLAAPGGRAGAQEEPAAPKVVAVQVEGNKEVSREAVLAHVKTRVGQPYSQQIVQADCSRLLKTGRFSGVEATRTPAEGGVIVTFLVAERPLVREVIFQGNKAFGAEELAKELTFAALDPLSDYAVQKGRRDLLRKYRGEGYYFVEVTVPAGPLQQRRVVYSIAEGPKVHIRKLSFEGNEAFSHFRLRRQVSVSARVWPFVAGTLDMEELGASVNALRALYVREGYLDAEVGRRLSFSEDKRTVAVTFEIREGPRYRVHEVRFEGNRVFTDEELRGRIELEAGEALTALKLRRDTERVQDTYGEVGYIEARVGADKRFASPEAPLPAWAQEMDEPPALVNLVFTIEEGGQFRVGRVDVRGNTLTQDRVIRRQLRFYPGQLFNAVAVENSRRRLLESRLFEEVDILRVGEAPDVRDVVVRVTEGRTAEFVVGAGVSSSSGLLGNISFRQRNFDLFGWPDSAKEFWSGQAFKGAGQTLEVVAEPGTELMRFHASWFEPALFDQPYALGTKAFLFTRGRETYDEQRYGGVVSLGHPFRNRWYGELSGRLEGVEIDDLDFDAPPEVVEVDGTHALVGLEGSLTRDRTDSRWLPSTGDRFRLSYEQVVGDFEFGRAVGEYRIYRTVYLDATDRKHIVAGRLKAGHLFGDAPVFERFYGGGLGSVRGFEYRGISPRSAGTDEPIGGDTMFFAGAEYTFPIVGTMREGALRGVVFLDSGTVEEAFEITTYRAAAGFGLRWTVPALGPVPIQLDFAWPLRKDDEDDTQIFSFSLGWTF